MNLSASDAELASALAVEAGRRLMALRAAGGDQAELRAAGDRVSHEYLMEELVQHRPGDAVLSEEGQDDSGRLTARRVWIVDPLDGTREFGEPDRSDWAVHVALWEEGELTAGAVALPAQGRVLSTCPGEVPADASQRALHDPLRMVVSRSRPPEFVRDLAASLGAQLLPMGSAGAKAAAVVTGEAEIYVHAGGQYEWDSAAPVAVARAAGLHASRIDGSSLTYNRAHPWMPDILICSAGLAESVLARLSSVNGLSGGDPPVGQRAHDNPAQH